MRLPQLHSKRNVCVSIVITQGGGFGGAKPLQATALFAPFGRLRRPNGAKKKILRGPQAPAPLHQTYPLSNYENIRRGCGLWFHSPSSEEIQTERISSCKGLSNK